MDESTAPTPDYMSFPKERPIGVTLLAVLSLIGGIVLAGILIYGVFFFSEEKRAEALRRVTELLGVPASILIVGIMFLLVLSCTSAVGMWEGKKWGWWLGSFWQMYAIFRNATAIYTVYDLTHSELLLPEPSGGVTKFYFKYAARLCFSLLLYLYFFKGNVREYFGLSDRPVWKPVLAQIAVCLGIVIGLSILAGALS